MLKLLVISLVLTISQTGLLAQDHSLIGVKKLGNCRARLDDGRVIDLGNLKSPFSDIQGIWRYTYTPCGTQNCDGAQATICQEATSGAYSFNIGSLDSVQFSMFDKELSMVYTAPNKKSTVICVCSEESKLTFEVESPQSNYKLVFSDPCCCPDRCKSSSSKLSGGSVLLIIFFVLLFVYFVGGVLYMKYVKNMSGPELIPNRDFWISFPGYVLSGFAFVKSKFTKQSNSYDQM